VGRTIREFRRIDILFNNAGIMRRTTVLDLREDDWDRVMAVNVKSIYLLSREAIPHMQKAGGGTIINTASGWGLAGGVKAAVYCASKGAVVQLTKAMAIDHGPQRIRVNSIAPATPTLACCEKKRCNSDSRTAAFLPIRQSVRWAAWERQKKLPKLPCFWQAVHLRLSRVRLWSSMAEGWQDLFESIMLSFNAR
jgi:NAD(P)-dependent dehydrogenase (short-subunit alcohol dehydrogenase family)